MTTDNKNARHTAEEVARLGDDIYEREIRQQVEAGHRGEIVAIDVDSGDYVIADTALVAAERLLARDPDADIWCIRVGYRALRSFGAGALRRTD